MRLRGIAAVGAGVAGAVLAHVLDQAGLLPGVHEAAPVRQAMGTTDTVGWLAIAAALSWLAAKWGPIRIGAPASLLIAALPELAGRHDIGAVAEPAAIAGAVLQWLLLLAVVAALVIVRRGFRTVLAPSYGAIASPAPTEPRHRARRYLVERRGRPRAPPLLPLSVPVT